MPKKPATATGITATTFGERVRAVRRLRKLKQNDLAGLARVSTISLYRIERKGAQPRGATITRLASALGVDPEWLETGGAGGPPLPADTPDSGEHPDVPWTVILLLASARMGPVNEDELLFLIKAATDDEPLTLDDLEIELLTRRARLSRDDPAASLAVLHAFERQRRQAAPPEQPGFAFAIDAEDSAAGDDQLTLDKLGE